MADKKISEMTSMTAGQIANDDAIVISDTSDSHTKKTNISELATFFGVNTEGQQDLVADMFVNGTMTGLSATYDDPNGVMNFSLAGGVTTAEMGHLSGTTSDIQTQFGTKAPIASPTFTGTASAPTASANDNSTKIATTAYVQGELSAYNTDTVTLTGKSGAISMWTNDSSYITASSSSALTNKTGSNSQWTNDESYIKAGTTDTLQNKTISGSNNTLSNIPYSAVSGIVDTDITSVSASDDELASSKAIKTYVDAQITGIDALSEAVDSNISSASAGQILVYDGTDSWDNQSSSISLTGQVTGTANMDSSGDVSIATTITSPSITINGQTCTLGGTATIPSVLQSGGTFTGEVHLNDSVKVGLGGSSGSSDMELYHDTTNSHIRNGTGELRVRGDTVKIKNDADDSTLATFTNGGAVELYHNGTKKAETVSGGLTVSGTLTATTLSGAISGNISQLTNDSAYLTTITSAQVVSALGFTPISTDTNTQIGGATGADFNDNVKLRWGTTDNDLEIYHDGSNSIIADTGTGGLQILSSQFKVMNSAGDENQVIGTQDGGVELYHDNIKMVETTADGVSIPDDKKLEFGASDDLQIYHDSTNNHGIIKETGTAHLKLQGENILLMNADATHTYVECVHTGSTQLYHNNSKKLETASGGVSVSGALTSSGDCTAFSDERLKSDIKTIDNALDKVSQMRGVSFTKDDKKGSGVIAQELEKVAPELVHDGEYKSVAYGNTVGYLIEAIKELKEEIEELKKDK